MTDTRLYIVTPCMNAGKTIDRTISSVLGQAGEFELFYHVQDGGSTDGTIELLKAWDERINNENHPRLCNALHFSFASEPDRGMYDAIAKGFARFDIGADDWMGWINADDILAYGAGSFLHLIDRDASGVSWVGGKGAIIKDDTVAVLTDRPVCSEIIGQGLCDGVHWEFVQQEGTFFRNSLWRKNDVARSFAEFKAAGDWNLWRKFAQHEQFHQALVPLAYFRQHSGQLSERARDTYRMEMDSIVPVDERRNRLSALDSSELVQDLLFQDSNDGTVAHRTKSLANHYAYRRNLVFGSTEQSAIAKNDDDEWRRYKPVIDFARKQVARQLSNRPATPKGGAASRDADPHIVVADNVIAYDHEWQFPAITEKHAFKKALEILPSSDGAIYVGFPWATLIDKLNNKSDDAPELLEKLLSLDLPKSGAVKLVTVSQHILTLHYRQLFFDAGITDIFWSHAVKGQSSIQDGRKIALHPFPLYPVQIGDDEGRADDEDRKHLFSFIGARANEWYLTKVRDWILDDLGDDERGFVIGRDTWHYNKVVYEHQIRKRAAAGDQLVDDQASLQFSQVMRDSVFALCPSGSGPNSIRLWEAIGMGAIPVILADTYAPPGDPQLWNAAAVFCEETPEAVRALPDRLEEMARDRALIQEKRKYLAQLWRLYGPDTFIYDVQKLFHGGDAAKDRQHAQLRSIARLINEGAVKARGDYDRFLDLCTARLLMKEETFGDLLKTDTDLRSACAYSLHQSRLSMAAQRFGEAQDAALRKPMRIAPASSLWRSRMKVFLFGKHSHRTPVSYEAYRPYFDANLAVTNDQKTADFIVSGFDLDFSGALHTLSDHASMRPQTRFLVLSEEPLWDTLWSKGYKQKSHQLKDREGELSYAIVNHFNSSVFDFEKIPYFITTDNDFLVRYVNYFRRNAALSVDEILQHWSRDIPRAAFFAEKRESERYDYHLPERDVYGLSAYRTRLAQEVADGGAIRIGKGWSDQKMRQSLPDWHLDKLSAVDRRVMILSGLENTHQHQYITEKILDAFAALAVPLYYASPDHRVHDLLPEGGFVNLYGASVEEAVDLVDAFTPDRDFARAYLASQQRLYDLFSDPKTIHLERVRVASAVLHEMKQLVS